MSFCFICNSTVRWNINTRYSKEGTLDAIICGFHWVIQLTGNYSRDFIYVCNLQLRVFFGHHQKRKSHHHVLQLHITRISVESRCIVFQFWKVWEKWYFVRIAWAHNTPSPIVFLFIHIWSVRKSYTMNTLFMWLVTIVSELLPLLAYLPLWHFLFV